VWPVPVQRPSQCDKPASFDTCSNIVSGYVEHSYSDNCECFQLYKLHVPGDVCQSTSTGLHLRTLDIDSNVIEVAQWVRWVVSNILPLPSSYDFGGTGGIENSDPRSTPHPTRATGFNFICHEAHAVQADSCFYVLNSAIPPASASPEKFGIYNCPGSGHQ
jgi:hypothetical protein